MTQIQLTYQNITCSVPQVSYLVQLYLRHVKMSTVMTRILYADATNLTISINGNNIKTFYIYYN